MAGKQGILPTKVTAGVKESTQSKILQTLAISGFNINAYVKSAYMTVISTVYRSESGSSKSLSILFAASICIDGSTCE